MSLSTYPVLKQPIRYHGGGICTQILRRLKFATHSSVLAHVQAGTRVLPPRKIYLREDREPWQFVLPPQHGAGPITCQHGFASSGLRSPPLNCLLSDSCWLEHCSGFSCVTQRNEICLPMSEVQNSPLSEENRISIFFHFVCFFMPEKMNIIFCSSKTQKAINLRKVRAQRHLCAIENSTLPPICCVLNFLLLSYCLSTWILVRPSQNLLASNW